MKRHLRPVAPLVEWQGQITPSSHRSPTSLKLAMMLLCKDTCAPVAPPFQWSGEAVSPSCTPVQTSLFESHAISTNTE